MDKKRSKTLKVKLRTLWKKTKQRAIFRHGWLCLCQATNWQLVISYEKQWKYLYVVCVVFVCVCFCSRRRYELLVFLFRWDVCVFLSRKRRGKQNKKKKISKTLKVKHRTLWQELTKQRAIIRHSCHRGATNWHIPHTKSSGNIDKNLRCLCVLLFFVHSANMGGFFLFRRDVAPRRFFIRRSVDSCFLFCLFHASRRSKK